MSVSAAPPTAARGTSSHESASGSSTAPEVAKRPGREVGAPRHRVRPAAPATWPSRTRPAAGARDPRPATGRLALGRGAEESHAVTVAHRRDRRYIAVVSATPFPSASTSPPRARGAAICARDDARASCGSPAGTPRACCRTSSRATSTRSRVGEGQYGLALTPKGKPAGRRLDRARGRRRVRVRLRGVAQDDLRRRCCSATGLPRAPTSHVVPRTS